MTQLYGGQTSYARPQITGTGTQTRCYCNCSATGNNRAASAVNWRYRQMGFPWSEGVHGSGKLPRSDQTGVVGGRLRQIGGANGQIVRLFLCCQRFECRHEHNPRRAFRHYPITTADRPPAPSCGIHCPAGQRRRRTIARNARARTARQIKLCNRSNCVTT